MDFKNTGLAKSTPSGTVCLDVGSREARGRKEQGGRMKTNLHNHDERSTLVNNVVQ